MREYFVGLKPTREELLDLVTRLVMEFGTRQFTFEDLLRTGWYGPHPVSIRRGELRAWVRELGYGWQVTPAGLDAIKNWCPVSDDIEQSENEE